LLTEYQQKCTDILYFSVSGLTEVVYISAFLIRGLEAFYLRLKVRDEASGKEQTGWALELKLSTKKLAVSNTWLNMDY